MGDNFDVGDDKPNTVNVRDKTTCVYMYVFRQNLSALFDNGFSLLLERLLRLDSRIPLKLGIFVSFFIRLFCKGLLDLRDKVELNTFLKVQQNQ